MRLDAVYMQDEDNVKQENSGSICHLFLIRVRKYKNQEDKTFEKCCVMGKYYFVNLKITKIGNKLRKT